MRERQDAFPGPCELAFGMEAAALAMGSPDAVLDASQESCMRVFGKRGLEIRTEILNADPPSQCEPNVIAALEQASRALGLKSQRDLQCLRSKRIHAADGLRRANAPWRPAASRN